MLLHHISIFSQKCAVCSKNIGSYIYENAEQISTGKLDLFDLFIGSNTISILNKYYSSSEHLPELYYQTHILMTHW